MADKQPRRPVQKPLVSTKLLLLAQHDNGKGKHIEIIFPFVLQLKPGPAERIKSEGAKS